MSIFSIGLSGLSAAQTALSTTSNNLSNVYTEGYNRQLPILGESYSNGSTGTGVSVDEVQRQFNSYVTEQYNDANSQTSALESYQSQVSQIDNLLADSDAGLAPLMQDFFSSLDDLSGAASDPAAREGVLGSASSMAAQFRSFDSYLGDMRSSLNGQLEGAATDINNTATQIASLNDQITQARAKSGEEPNTLLDKRDKLVSDLNELVGADLNVQDGDSYNINLENGQPLVSGTRSYDLEAVSSSEDPSRTVIGYRDAAGNVNQIDDSAFENGELGGLLSFRSETLDNVQNQLGRMTAVLGSEFNAVHEDGVDLNGDDGEAFFNVGSPRVMSNSENDGTGGITAEYDDVNQLTSSDYRITATEDDGVYQAERLSDGKTTTLTLDGDEKASLDGVSLTFSGDAQEGDTFMLQPTRTAAQDFEVAISEGSEIAASSSADGDDSNGDVGSGNNENALALLDLQSEKIVGGTSSVSDAYASLVNDVGNTTNITQVNLDAQSGLTEQLREYQQSESGVNLDEEYANLVRYQQYYQANARVIDVGSQVLDSVLQLR
ncbi:flagellar hook-associated protein FlgK [Chromohalobacter canadensis]|uniref:flagellar hook-associated protein FlgK n=1 Tax=Chromohalobacter canadensis TaxID=141389 RepID=UPI0021C17AAE|nr:flagellar hook-associated protein FlgK [Chromohalobacter canadensis]MCT8469793.1 flagellar hook-associated protein FlgK [Chromohalobacter canadensis]MCT8472372.1 flagellar hook-associated protein FlgK [Chromohalobacter canadensis]MCT8499515.1 flagellar hook-associated protein FlgK [Chromohalobacter canadensis]